MKTLYNASVLSCFIPIIMAAGIQPTTNLVLFASGYSFLLGYFLAVQDRKPESEKANKIYLISSLFIFAMVIGAVIYGVHTEFKFLTERNTKGWIILGVVLILNFFNIHMLKKTDEQIKEG